MALETGNFLLALDYVGLFLNYVEMKRSFQEIYVSKEYGKSLDF